MSNGANADALDDEGKTPKDIAPSIFGIEPSPKKESADTKKDAPLKDDNVAPIPEEREEDKKSSVVEDSEAMEVESDDTSVKTENEVSASDESSQIDNKSESEESVRPNQQPEAASEQSKSTDEQKPDPNPDVHGESETLGESSSVNKVEELEAPESMDLIESTPQLEAPSPSKRSLRSPRKNINSSKNSSEEKTLSPSKSRKPEARTSLKFSTLGPVEKNASKDADRRKTLSAKPSATSGGDGGPGVSKASGRRSSLPSAAFGSRGAMLLQMSKKSSAAFGSKSLENAGDTSNTRYAY